MSAPGDAAPGPDPAAGSFLVVAIGTGPTTVARTSRWVRLAESVAPTTLLLLDDIDAPPDVATLAEALDRARTGVRFLVAGGRYDALQCVARLRDRGVLPAEITVELTHRRDLPLYCAHCRARHRVAGEPGDVVTCPGCARRLEVHDHLASALGCYLASDTQAGELVP